MSSNMIRGRVRPPRLAARFVRLWRLSSALSGLLCVLLLPAQPCQAQQTFEEYIEVGSQSLQRGRYQEAEALFLKAMEFTKELDPLSPVRAEGLEKLGAVHRAQGKFDQAKMFLEQALAIRKQARGMQPVDLGAAMNNLAVVNEALGHLGEAERLYRACAALWRKLLGPMHPDYAVVTANLASLLRLQGRYTEAEELYRTLVEIREKTVGPNHVLTAHSLSSLAGVLSAQRKDTEAVTLYHRTLSIRAAHEGDSTVAADLNGMGNCLTRLGRHDEALKVLQQSKTLYSKLLGQDAPETMRASHDVGVVYFAQGRHAEAELVYKQVLETWGRTLGNDHVFTQAVLRNMILLYLEQGRRAEAVTLERQLVSLAQ